MEKGLVKIYFGEGKGKSTSSMGRALVCAGEEKEVFVIQFLKGKMTGSLDYLKTGAGDQGFQVRKRRSFL